MSGKVPMTAAGLRKLKEELKLLKTVERIRISKEIEVARGHGDLRENAEYHAAKEKQAHIEARIRLVDEWIANAEVIDVTKLKGEQVVFGATVVLLDMETEKEVRYRIVGEVEADLKKRHLSVTSPLARAVIGKKVGDQVTVQSPSGSRDYELRRIDFEETD
jgi:transcription elongation factor GreA